MERMLHLVDMRKDNIVQLILGNSVLRNLTLSQITHEEYLFRYEVKKGTHIWHKETLRKEHLSWNLVL